jgi:PAS domain S-box-containing protein
MLNKKLKELSRLHHQIEDEEKNFSDLLKLSVDLICVIDNNGNFLMVSDSFCQLTEFSREELLSTSYLNRIRKDCIQSTIEAAASLKDKDVIDFINIYVSKSGKEYKISWRANSYIDNKSLAIGRVIL